MAAACNDGFIKLFLMQEVQLMASVKGVFGAPLCLDVSKDNSLLAAGYEDDTFILYQMNFGINKATASITPICRGQGHKSFVSQIKFDHYLMEYL